MQVLFVLGLTDDTRALDTLNEVSLAEQVNNNQRCHNEQCAGIVNRGIEQALSRIGGDKRLRHRDDTGHQYRFGIREEYGGVEVVGPLPREREQEDGDHHRDRKRQDDLKEGAVYARTVNICGFLKFIGNACKELTHHEDEQTVLECETGE